MRGLYCAIGAVTVLSLVASCGALGTGARAADVVAAAAAAPMGRLGCFVEQWMPLAKAAGNTLRTLGVVVLVYEGWGHRALLTTAPFSYGCVALCCGATSIALHVGCTLLHGSARTALFPGKLPPAA
eukprot:gene3823-6176_t